MTVARWLPFVAAIGCLACGNPEAARIGPSSTTLPPLPPGAPIRPPTGAGGAVASSGTGTGGAKSPPSVSGADGGAGVGGAPDVDASPPLPRSADAAPDLASPPAEDGGAGGASVPPPVDAAPEAPAAVPYPTMGWVVTASIAAGPNDVAANATDGDLATRWSTGQPQVGNESFSIDLGARVSMSQVVLDDSSHPGDFPAAYTLALSTDGVAYVTVAMGAGATVTTIRFTPRVARFVRLLQTGTTPVSWLSIDELTIWP